MFADASQVQLFSIIAPDLISFNSIQVSAHTRATVLWFSCLPAPTGCSTFASLLSGGWTYKKQIRTGQEVVHGNHLKVISDFQTETRDVQTWWYLSWPEMWCLWTSQSFKLLFLYKWIIRTGLQVLCLKAFVMCKMPMLPHVSVVCPMSCPSCLHENY